MGKCLTKIVLLSYGVFAILLWISAPILGEALYTYGPEFVRDDYGLKFGVAASGFLLWIAVGISVIASFFAASDIKCK